MTNKPGMSLLVQIGAIRRQKMCHNQGLLEDTDLLLLNFPVAQVILEHTTVSRVGRG